MNLRKLCSPTNLISLTSKMYTLFDIGQCIIRGSTTKNKD